jgi:beta-lactamase regulating signal transducer with metallopeptidase domain
MTLDHLATTAFGVGLESSVRVAVLAVLAAIALAIIRPKRAAASLSVWSAVLAIACVLPLMECVAPALWPVPIVTSIQAEPQPGTFVQAAMPIGIARSSPVASDLAAPVLEPIGERASVTAPRAPRSIDWIAIAASVYVLVALAFFAQLFAGWRATRALRRHARSVEDDDSIRAAVAWVVPVGRVPSCAIVESDAVVVPISVGHRRPAVVLPLCWRQWSGETLDAVLAHELSHVRRGDAWRQLAALVYRAVMWPSPVAWLLRRVVIDLAERASDEAALAVSGDRAGYAELLLSFFGQAAGSHGRADWSLAMARGRGAERRIARVLRWEPRQPRRSWGRALVTLALAAPAVTIVAAASPVATATSVDVPNEWPRAIARPIVEAVTPWVDVGMTSQPSALQPSAAQPRDAAAAAIQAPRGIEAMFGTQDRGPSLDEISGSRRVLLLFDVARLDETGLTNAKRLAAQYIESLDRRSSVGLDVVHVWAAAPFLSGAVPEFTRDVEAVKRQVAAIAAPTAEHVDAPSPRTIGSVCAALAASHASSTELQLDVRPIGRSYTPSDSKLVLLFADRNDVRSVDSWPSYTLASANCLRDGVPFFPITPAGVPWGATTAVMPTARFPFRVVSFAGTPVSLAQDGPDLQSGYATVTVHNDSSKAVRSVTLSALITPKDPQFAPTRSTRSGPPTAIPAGGTAQIASQLVSDDLLRTLKVAGASVDVSVSDVEFADGTAWRGVAMNTAPPQSEQSARPPDAIVPDRNITLLFDLREASGTTLRVDLEQAALLIAVSNDATRKGLDVPHRFSVATLTDHVDQLSDSLVSDGELMYLMRGLADAPPADVAAAARDRALSQYCDDLGRRFYFFNDPASDQAIVYYGDPRGMANAGPLYMAVSANACRASHVRLFFGSASLAAQVVALGRLSAPPPVPVRATAAAGAPVTLEKVNPTLQSGYVLVTVRNTSTKTIRSVTLEAVVRGKNSTPAGRVVRRSGPETVIAPGKAVDIGSLLVNLSDLFAVAPDPTVEVSVVEVDFTDGTSWKAAQKPSGP